MEIQKKRILIVEDDLTYGTMMQTWLGKKGYDVERVTRVSDAVKALIGSKFNLVLSDMRLPDRDGMHLLEWMQRSAVGTPFIMMTSYAEVQNAVEAMKHGACDYIAKPCQPDILLTKINDAIGDNDTSQTSTANDVEKTAGS
ncbi:MAG: response regulator, partial [Prevotella sp.]|nr:response regulator [Prevotella sp.]